MATACWTDPMYLQEIRKSYKTTHAANS